MIPYIYREQDNVPIIAGPGECIDIPVARKKCMDPVACGGTRILEPGLYMATWSLPILFNLPLPLFPFNVVVNLYNVDKNEILGRSATNVFEPGGPGPGPQELGEVLSGSCIFVINEPNQTIELRNYSSSGVVVSPIPGTGFVYGGATFTIHRIG